MIDLNNLETNLDNYMSFVGKPALNINQVTQQSIYESLIAGAVALRAKNRGCEDVNSMIPLIKVMIEWLRNTDFYVAPASTKYHGSFPGGLIVHSLKAYNHMIELHSISSFNNVDIGSAALVILCHDWCKIGKYEKYIKNEKNPNTGVWEEKLAYRWNQNYMGLGHGPQSLVILSQFCNTKYTLLNFDEMAAIRWHMYTYDVTSYDVDDLNKCSTSIPLVMLIQFSDQLAAREG